MSSPAVCASREQSVCDRRSGSERALGDEADRDIEPQRHEFRATAYVRWALQGAVLAIAGGISVGAVVPLFKGLSLVFLPTSGLLVIIAGLVAWNFCFSHPTRITIVPAALFVRVWMIEIPVQWSAIECVVRREASRAMGETCWMAMYPRGDDVASIITRRPIWMGSSITFARHTMPRFDELMNLLQERLPNKVQPPE
ncbi:MAG: hypothetical protein ACE5JM_05035 [Armatimonadota bacterium]